MKRLDGIVPFCHASRSRVTLKHGSKPRVETKAPPLSDCVHCRDNVEHDIWSLGGLLRAFRASTSDLSAPPTPCGQRVFTVGRRHRNHGPLSDHHGPGSHGMAAADFPAMLQMVLDGKLRPAALVGREVNLEEGCAAIEVTRPLFPYTLPLLSPRTRASARAPPPHTHTHTCARTHARTHGCTLNDDALSARGVRLSLCASGAMQRVRATRRQTQWPHAGQLNSRLIAALACRP